MRTGPSSVESTLLSSLKLSTCAFARRGEGISRSCVAAIIPNPLLLKILGFSFSAIGHLQAVGIAQQVGRFSTEYLLRRLSSSRI